MEFDYKQAIKHISHHFEKDSDAVLAGYSLACLSIMRDNNLLKLDDPEANMILDTMKKQAHEKSHLPYLKQ